MHLFPNTFTQSANSLSHTSSSQLLIGNDRRIAASLLPLPCGFTLLIPEGPRVLHSWHSDLSPSSVTYYRRLLSPRSFHSKRGPRQPVRGEEDETRLTRKNSRKNIGITLNFNNEVENNVSLWWARELVRRATLFFCLYHNRKTNTKIEKVATL